MIKSFKAFSHSLQTKEPIVYTCFTNSTIITEEIPPRKKVWFNPSSVFCDQEWFKGLVFLNQ